jgi:hypothetical protein
MPPHQPRENRAEALVSAISRELNRSYKAKLNRSLQIVNDILRRTHQAQYYRNVVGRIRNFAALPKNTNQRRLKEAAKAIFTTYGAIPNHVPLNNNQKRNALANLAYTDKWETIPVNTKKQIVDALGKTTPNLSENNKIQLLYDVLNLTNQYSNKHGNAIHNAALNYATGSRAVRVLGRVFRRLPARRRPAQPRN